MAVDGSPWGLEGKRWLHSSFLLDLLFSKPVATCYPTPRGNNGGASFRKPSLISCGFLGDLWLNWTLCTFQTYRPQRTSGLGSIGYSKAPVPWLVDQWGVAVTPTDQGRSLAVLTQLLHRPAIFTPLSVEIKPVLLVVNWKGERRPALICTSVRGIFLPSSFSLESSGPQAARSLCFQQKRKWMKSRLICSWVNKWLIVVMSE